MDRRTEEEKELLLEREQETARKSSPNATTEALQQQADARKAGKLRTFFTSLFAGIKHYAALIVLIAFVGTVALVSNLVQINNGTSPLLQSAPEAQAEYSHDGYPISDDTSLLNYLRNDGNYSRIDPTSPAASSGGFGYGSGYAWNPNKVLSGKAAEIPINANRSFLAIGIRLLGPSGYDAAWNCYWNIKLKFAAVDSSGTVYWLSQTSYDKSQLANVNGSWSTSDTNYCRVRQNPTGTDGTGFWNTTYSYFGGSLGSSKYITKVYVFADAADTYTSTGYGGAGTESDYIKFQDELYAQGNYTNLWIVFNGVFSNTSGSRLYFTQANVNTCSFTSGNYWQDTANSNAHCLALSANGRFPGGMLIGAHGTTYSADYNLTININKYCNYVQIGLRLLLNPSEWVSQVSRTFSFWMAARRNGVTDNDFGYNWGSYNDTYIVSSPSTTEKPNGTYVAAGTTNGIFNVLTQSANAAGSSDPGWGNTPMIYFGGYIPARYYDQIALMSNAINGSFCGFVEVDFIETSFKNENCYLTTNLNLNTSGRASLRSNHDLTSKTFDKTFYGNGKTIRIENVSFPNAHESENVSADTGNGILFGNLTDGAVVQDLTFKIRSSIYGYHYTASKDNYTNYIGAICGRTSGSVRFTNVTVDTSSGNGISFRCRDKGGTGAGGGDGGCIGLFVGQVNGGTCRIRNCKIIHNGGLFLNAADDNGNGDETTASRANAGLAIGVEQLARGGNIVVTVGGGGIPVVEKDGYYVGVEAVIDKDLASSLAAVQVKADEFYILTDVPQAYINFRKENEKALGRITVAEAKKYLEEGQFTEGSMAPKMRAAIKFVEETGHEAVITDATSLGNPNAGTRIVK